VRQNRGSLADPPIGAALRVIRLGNDRLKQANEFGEWRVRPEGATRKRGVSAITAAPMVAGRFRRCRMRSNEARGGTCSASRRQFAQVRPNVDEDGTVASRKLRGMNAGGRRGVSPIFRQWAAAEQYRIEAEKARQTANQAVGARDRAFWLALAAN